MRAGRNMYVCMCVCRYIQRDARLGLCVCRLCTGVCIYVCVYEADNLGALLVHTHGENTPNATSLHWPRRRNFSLINWTCSEKLRLKYFSVAVTFSSAQGGHGLSRGTRTNAAGHGNSATDRAWHVHVHATQGSRASHSIFSLCTYVLTGTFSGILLIDTTFHPRGKMTYARCLIDIYFAHAYRQYMVNSFALTRANSTCTQYTQYTHAHPLYTIHIHIHIHIVPRSNPHPSPYHCPKTTHIFHTHIPHTYSTHERTSCV